VGDHGTQGRDRLLDGCIGDGDEACSERHRIVRRGGGHEDPIIEPCKCQGKGLKPRVRGGSIIKVQRSVRVTSHGDETGEPHVELSVGQRGNLALKRADSHGEIGRAKLEEKIGMQFRQLGGDEIEILLPGLGVKELGWGHTR
jgi:hypothetical protein